MERQGTPPGGLVSEIVNLHSKKAYVVGTAPETGRDYWSTVVMPTVQRRAFFGFMKVNVPNPYQQLFSFIRNNQKDAHAAHHQVKFIVSSLPEADWLRSFPSPSPPDGLSTDARKNLQEQIGGFSDAPELASSFKTTAKTTMQISARDIVYAFAQTRGQLTQPILDVRLLPHPKQATLEAFKSYEAELLVQTLYDPAAKTELEQVRALAMRVYEFQIIDPDDIAIVMEINSGERFRRFRERRVENLSPDEEADLNIFNQYFHKYFTIGMDEQNSH